MQAHIICVGDELLTGQVTNGNVNYLSRRLWSAGIPVSESCVVGDDSAVIGAALKRALKNSEVVLLTGGLGPTADDLTREAVAAVLKRPLVTDCRWLSVLEDFFHQRGLPMTDNNRKQALMIAGGQLLSNSRGTAPGILIKEGDRRIILLPGPPGEMEPMFEKEVLPLLGKWSGGEVLLTKTLKCIGLGESSLEDRIKAAGPWEFPPLAFLAKGPEVHIQLKAGGEAPAARAIIAGAEERLRQILGDLVYGSDRETLAGVVLKLLGQMGLNLSLAESVTGGMISGLITTVPGSSASYLGGVVVYSDGAKIGLLGLDAAALARYGAVSPESAKAMALGARRVFSSDLALAVSGLAGPAGDASKRPVGLVYTALSASEGCRVEERLFGGDREAIRKRAAFFALDLVRQYLLLRQRRSLAGWLV